MSSCVYLFQSLLVLAFVAVQSYDENKAIEAVHYSYAAYCQNPSLTQWNCKWCTNANFDISSNGAGVVTTDSLQGFMGYDTNEKQIVLSFRGTVMSNFQDWIDDLEMTKTAYPHYKNGTGQVHYGFHKAWQQLEAAGLTTMIESMFAGYPDADILITGHSLGGALAQMASLEMKQNPIYNTLSIGKVQSITFGSPRWCDETIATLYRNVVDSNWRIVNQRDVIPTAPLMHLGYHHTATMIRYIDAKTKNYTQCDGTGEDWTSHLCYYYVSSIMDHLYYFDLYESCKDDTTDNSANTDDDVVSASNPTDELTDDVDSMSSVAMWFMVGGSAIGWILAVLFGCCWYRTRSKLQKTTKVIGFHRAEASYLAFNEQF